jgi:hypothetical protein
LIAETRAILGDLPGARQIASELKDERSIWALRSLAEQLVIAGRKSEAVALAHAQEIPRTRAYALSGTAEAMLEQIAAADKRKL